jgi:NAD-dependent deacetylase
MRCKQGNLDVQWTKNTPSCPNCGLAKTRPDVVLFGEKLNMRLFRGIESFARNDADVIIAIGTSLNVFPAAGLVMDNVDYKKIVIINKDKTPFDKFASLVIHDDCDKVIDNVLETM